MNRQEKEHVIKELQNCFHQHPVSFLVTYKGTSVGMLQKLRRQLRGHDALMQVAKARLMRIAAQETACKDEITPFFKDQVALVFAKDSPAVAKLLFNFSKENSSLKFVIGCADDRVVTEQMFVTLATLPSREQLLANFVGVLQAPMGRLAYCLKMRAQQLGGGVEGEGEQNNENKTAQAS